MAAPYKVGDIANYFLDRASAEGATLTPMKLQKLVYFANGWYSGFKMEPLIDQPFEVWKWGPVEPLLYQEMKDFEDRPITRSSSLISGEPGEPVLDQEAIDLLDAVWKKYAHMSPAKLSAYTHEGGSPWEQTVLKFGALANVPRKTTLNNDQVAQYFRKKINHNRNAA